MYTIKYNNKMMNDNYYYKYEQIVEPLYGVKRNLDSDVLLMNDNILPHALYYYMTVVDFTRYRILLVNRP